LFIVLSFGLKINNKIRIGKVKIKDRKVLLLVNIYKRFYRYKSKITLHFVVFPRISEGICVEKQSKC